MSSVPTKCLPAQKPLAKSDKNIKKDEELAKRIAPAMVSCDFIAPWKAPVLKIDKFGRVPVLGTVGGSDWSREHQIAKPGKVTSSSK